MNNYFEKIESTLRDIISSDSSDDAEKKFINKESKRLGIGDKVIGLNIIDINIISIVGAERNPVSSKNIVNLVNFSQPTVSRSISKLEKRSLLNKYFKSNTNREFFVSLTDYGEILLSIHHELDKRIINQLKDGLSNYSESELKTFIGILTTINELNNRRKIQ